jgi:F0F1-type ATP synthase assembly protein I
VEHEQPSQATHPKRDGLTISFELVFTPAIFAIAGHGLDRWLGTSPLFMVGLAAVTFVTVIAMTVWRYNTELAEHDAERRAMQAARGARPARWEASEAAQARATAAQFATDVDVLGTAR